MTFYLDANILVSLALAEPASFAARAFVVDNAGHLGVSTFAAGEFASALSLAVRDHRIDETDARQRFEDFDIWRAAATSDVAMGTSDLLAGAALVRRFDLKLRLPDAIHAACCQRLGLTLVTFDNRLAEAARALAIAVAQPVHSASALRP